MSLFLYLIFSRVYLYLPLSSVTLDDLPLPSLHLYPTFDGNTWYGWWTYRTGRGSGVVVRQMGTFFEHVRGWHRFFNFKFFSLIFLFQSQFLDLKLQFSNLFLLFLLRLPSYNVSILGFIVTFLQSSYCLIIQGSNIEGCVCF